MEAAPLLPSSLGLASCLTFFLHAFNQYLGMSCVLQRSSNKKIVNKYQQYIYLPYFTCELCSKLVLIYIYIYWQVKAIALHCKKAYQHPRVLILDLVYVLLYSGRFPTHSNSVQMGRIFKAVWTRLLVPRWFCYLCTLFHSYYHSKFSQGILNSKSH